MHQIIVGALEQLGITAQLFRSAQSGSHPGPLCFHDVTPGDVVIGAHKIVGSAQRKSHGALLQHGGVLLAASCHAPTLLGTKELTGRQLEAAPLSEALAVDFQQTGPYQLRVEEMLSSESSLVAELVARKYVTKEWNSKR
jgi:lipoate-protein ligase A